MAREATNALNGDPVGVECPAAGALPKFVPTKSKIKFTLLVERMKADAAALQQAQAERRSNLDKLIEAKRKILELRGADAKAAAELAGLEKQRQSLGPLTIKAAAPPPPPPVQGPSTQTAEEAKKSAMAEALAAAEAAEAAYDAATRTETAKDASLKRLSSIAEKIEKGEPAGAKLLEQTFH